MLYTRLTVSHSCCCLHCFSFPENRMAGSRRQTQYHFVYEHIIRLVNTFASDIFYCLVSFNWKFQVVCYLFYTYEMLGIEYSLVQVLLNASGFMIVSPALWFRVRRWPSVWTRPPSRQSLPSPALRRGQKARPTLTGQASCLWKGSCISLHTTFSPEVLIKGAICKTQRTRLCAVASLWLWVAVSSASSGASSQTADLRQWWIFGVKWHQHECLDPVPEEHCNVVGWSK